MGAGHAHPLYYHGHSRLHRLAPQVKVAAAFGFVLAVAVTPREAVFAFAVDAVVLAALVLMARLPVGFVMARMAVVVPFVLFALAIPFVATGPTTEVLGMEMSRQGLWATFNILAKATLGVTVSVLLAGTTEEADILKGLERLRVPVVLTMIAAFMLRYLALIAGEISRVRTAMTARGHDPRWLWQARPMASASGALFIRSFERGERVHAAMLSRGFTGTMPELRPRTATTREWLAAAIVVVVAASMAAAGMVVT